MRRVFLLLMIVLLPGLACAALGVADASVTVRITDEDGLPVKNAEVVVSFNQPKTMSAWDGVKGVPIKGTTGADGVIAAASPTLKKIHVAAEKDGYYPSSTYYSFDREEGGRWQLWNPTLEVRLRKMISPVPLKAKWFFDVELPATNITIGYDMLIGDWVAPRGGGVESDVTFTLVRDYMGRSDYASTLTIATAQKHDGFVAISDRDVISQSAFRFPRQAPEIGYDETHIVLSASVRPGQSDKQISSTEAQNLFFRIRTELDESGHVKRALYGKLIGPVECSLHDTQTGKLRLTYYLNPKPNDRNLEFDPRKNLFENLQWFERVKDP